MSAQIVPIQPACSDEELEHEIVQLAARIHAATYQLLVLIGEWDRREAWASWGMRSCAHWLNWKCGIDMGAAREKVRVARCLPELPHICRAFARGEISYSKVRAMSRVATFENEADLLELARNGTASHIETIVRLYRRMDDHAALNRANRVHECREVRFYYDDDGSFVLRGRLTPEQGAMIAKAIECGMEHLYSPDVSAETFSARRADALAMIAETFLTDHANRAPDSAAADRHQVVLHVEADSAVLEDGPGVSAETSRRLLCDASVVRMTVDGEGNPLDVGRKTRSIPPAMRRALKVRDKCCRFPGCDARYFVDGHHIQHWADGGTTCLDNLVMLCRHHHRLMHEGGFGVRRTETRDFEFVRPDGVVVPQNDEPDGCSGPLPHLAKAKLTFWQGESIDYGIALDGLRGAELRADAHCRLTG